MSKPCSAAGTRPTALITEVRPPTQSYIGKRASQPFFSAYLIQLAADAGDRDRVLARNPGPLSRKRASASSMPLRVSFVPPDFEITTDERVLAGRRRFSSRTRSKPSGSVLSKKKMSIGSRAEPSASAMNCGPSAEPPMPMSRTCSNGLPFGAAIRPTCTSAANFLIRSFVSSISARSSSLGASCGSRSQ